MTNFWRHLIKYKTYAFINLFGLSLGLTVSTLIVLHVLHESAYDKFLPGYDQVLRIQPEASTGDNTQTWATTEGFLAPALSNAYSEIESATRIMPSTNDIVFKADSTTVAQSGVILADEQFFKVMPYPFVYGDPATALKKPDGIILTLSMSTKFFGHVNPIGSTLSTSFMTFEVTGVLADIPATSHLHFSAVFPLRLWIPDADQSRQM